MNKDDALSTLIDLKRVLDELQIPFWITDGTLLGYYREKDFISHDPDIDIGIFIDDWKDNLLNKLAENNFKLIWQFGLKECGLEYAIEKRDIKIDLFFFYKGIPNRNVYWHAAWTVSPKIGGEFRKLIRFTYEPFELQQIKFKNIELLTPDNIEKYVTRKYGKDWRTPKKIWDWARDPCNSEFVDIFIEYQIL